MLRTISPLGYNSDSLPNHARAFNVTNGLKVSDCQSSRIGAPYIQHDAPVSKISSFDVGSRVASLRLHAKDALHAQNAAPVVVALDWKGSVLQEDKALVRPYPAASDLDDSQFYICTSMQ